MDRAWGQAGNQLRIASDQSGWQKDEHHGLLRSYFLGEIGISAPSLSVAPIAPWRNLFWGNQATSLTCSTGLQPPRTQAVTSQKGVGKIPKGHRREILSLHRSRRNVLILQLAIVMNLVYKRQFRCRSTG